MEPRFHQLQQSPRPAEAAANSAAPLSLASLAAGVHRIAGWPSTPLSPVAATRREEAAERRGYAEKLAMRGEGPLCAEVLRNRWKLAMSESEAKARNIVVSALAEALGNDDWKMLARDVAARKSEGNLAEEATATQPPPTPPRLSPVSSPVKSPPWKGGSWSPKGKDKKKGKGGKKHKKKGKDNPKEETPKKKAKEQEWSTWNWSGGASSGQSSDLWLEGWKRRAA